MAGVGYGGRRLGWEGWAGGAERGWEECSSLDRTDAFIRKQPRVSGESGQVGERRGGWG